MNYSFAAFQEPRGVMRILQFVFAIVAFSTTINFSTDVKIHCVNKTDIVIHIDYPFEFENRICDLKTISADASSDAQFYVATGILSMLYCMFIIVVYALIDELYRTKSEFPLADFFLTTILAIFWLSGSAAWSNGTTGLKNVTDPDYIAGQCKDCHVDVTGFSRLNISLVIGFLNFFLWASDLWFLYKETIWFQGRSQSTNMQNQQSA